jgi:alpha-beta hydrolase superfamily lysophospholipase
VTVETLIRQLSTAADRLDAKGLHERAHELRGHARAVTSAKMHLEAVRDLVSGP